MADVEVRSIETGIHGRVLVRAAGPGPAAGLLVGFHGYAENAAIQMDRLAGIPGAGRWTLLSIQGLHRFYRGRSEDVVASWMTREDREAAIADNLAYVDRAIASVAPADRPRIVCAGFSQGVAMAFRAGVRGAFTPDAIVSVGGDVPPELVAAGGAFPRVLLARGTADGWYTEAKMHADLTALGRLGADVRPLVYDGGHDWTADVSSAVAAFISTT